MLLSPVTGRLAEKIPFPASALGGVRNQHDVFRGSWAGPRPEFGRALSAAQGLYVQARVVFIQTKIRILSHFAAFFLLLIYISHTLAATRTHGEEPCMRLRGTYVS